MKHIYVYKKDSTVFKMNSCLPVVQKLSIGYYEQLPILNNISHSTVDINIQRSQLS